jgi:hypothetical protein
MGAWTLLAKLEMCIEPALPRDCLLRSPEGDILVETKAPFHGPAEAIEWEQGVAAIEACLDAASAKLKAGGRNLLLIALPLHNLDAARHELVTALIGRQAFVVPIRRGGGIDLDAGRAELIPDGRLVVTHGRSGRPFKKDGRPRYTRVSAVLFVQEEFRHQRRGDPNLANHWVADHKVLVLHNPAAEVPISPEIWGRVPQWGPTSVSRDTYDWNDDEDSPFA